jgi:TatD family-associated radical SAM protein
VDYVMPQGNLTYWKGDSFYINPCSRCTNNCLFCVRHYSDGVYGFNLKHERDPTPDELSNAIIQTWNNKFSEAAIVGFGEPLLNLEGTLASVRTLKDITDVPVRINTNGQALLLYPSRDVPSELANVGIESVQVSLNSPDAHTYARLCQSKFGEKAFDSVLEFAKRCIECMHVEISALDIPGIDLEACREIAEGIGADFCVRQFSGPAHELEMIAIIMRQLARSKKEGNA